MSATANRNRYDALIVGARCAGAATAMLLARAGARVLVVDHDRPGTDTMSTHALMRTAVFQLQRWGLLEDIAAAGTPAIRRTSFVYADESVDVDIRPEGAIAGLYAPRRYLLDAVVASAAAAAGAELRYQTSFRSLVRNDAGQVCGARLRNADGREDVVRADIVIGADGRRSAVAQAAGARITRQIEAHAACVYRYIDAFADTGSRWYFADRASAGVIPTNGGQACVFVAVPPERFAQAAAEGPDVFDRLIARHLPELAEQLAGASGTGAVVFRGSPGHLRDSAGAGWALVGDAGHFRDPITAHGISDAFRDAELLAQAILTNRLAGYTQRRDAMAGDIFEITHRIAALDWTTDEIKALHMDLNRAMKANLAAIVAVTSGSRKAA